MHKFVSILLSAALLIAPAARAQDALMPGAHVPNGLHAAAPAYTVLCNPTANTKIPAPCNQLPWIGQISLGTGTIPVGDAGLLIVNSGANVTFTLPSASAAKGRTYFFLKSTSSDVTTITAAGSSVIVGIPDWLIASRTSILLSQIGDTVGVQSNGADWFIVTGSASMVGAAPDGKAHLRPYPYQLLNNQGVASTVAWHATDPTGADISIPSTTTNGLNEFLAAVTTNGWPAEVNCQGRYGGNGGGFPAGTQGLQINATSTVLFPAQNNWSFKAIGCTLLASPPSQADPGVEVDSCGDCDIDWEGVVVYQTANAGTQSNSSCALDIEPLNDSADGFPGLYAGRIHFLGLVAYQVAAGSPQRHPLATICLNTESGPVSGESLEFEDINVDEDFAAHLVPYGLWTSGAHGIQNDYFRLANIYGSSTYAVSINNSATASVNYGNIFEIPGIAFYTGYGVVTQSSYDTWILPYISQSNSGGVGVATSSIALSNTFLGGLINTTTVKSDSGPAQGTSGANMWVGGLGVSCPSAGVARVSGGIVGTC